MKGHLHQKACSAAAGWGPAVACPAWAGRQAGWGIRERHPLPPLASSATSSVVSAHVALMIQRRGRRPGPSVGVARRVRMGALGGRAATPPVDAAAGAAASPPPQRAAPPGPSYSWFPGSSATARNPDTPPPTAPLEACRPAAGLRLANVDYPPGRSKGHALRSKRRNCRNVTDWQLIKPINEYLAQRAAPGAGARPRTVNMFHTQARKAPGGGGGSRGDRRGGDRMGWGPAALPCPVSGRVKHPARACPGPALSV